MRWRSALPPMRITAISEREVPSAVRTTQALTAEVVAGYCERLGGEWVRPMQPA